MALNGTLTAMNGQKGHIVQTRPLAVEELGVLSDALLALANRAFDWIEAVLQPTRPDLFPVVSDQG